MPHAEIDKIIAMARRNGAIVFLDIQPGHSDVLTEARMLSSYLVLPDVHLGLDPEYNMTYRQVPCSAIGTLDAGAINEVSAFLAGVVREHRLPPKIVVVHRFTQAMVTNAHNITRRPEVQFVMNMDGFGSPAKKKIHIRLTSASILFSLPGSNSFTRSIRFRHPADATRRGPAPATIPGIHSISITNSHFMKKIIIAFDGTNYSAGAVSFAADLNKRSPILLVGSFLPQIDLSSSWSYAMGGAGLYNPLVEDFNAEAIEAHVHQFEKECNSEGIEWLVHKNPFDLAIPEIRKESRFADLLLIGGESFYRQYGMERPNEYLRMTLQEAECPVIVVPEDFPFPDRIMLAYDGSEDSVYAIRQFALQFPELARMPATLVYATTRKHSGLPEKDYILELCSRHFPDLTVKMLESTTRKQFGEWLNGHQTTLLVCGAFGRNDISMMFRRSFAAGAIVDHKIPVFIAHRS